MQQQRPPAPKPAPPPPKVNESMNSVFSFFKDVAPEAPANRAAAAIASEGPRPVQFDPSAIRPASQKSETPRGELKRGARVRHEQFGDGTILTMEGNGPDAKLTVYFDRAGSKKFVAKYAKLVRI